MQTELECSQNLYFGSLARIADLHLSERPFTIKTAPREIWKTGDYVVGRYLGSNGNSVDYLELCDGTLYPLKQNDLVVGAFGERQATQEVVGTWKLIGKGTTHPKMQHICGSGMFGAETSRAKGHNASANYRYEGHCFRLDRKVCMRDFAPKIEADGVKRPSCPTILIVGSSMSCGKTISAKVIIDIVKNDLGYEKVAGAKFTGGGYRHDTKQMSEAGADRVIDFVDAGYCSTVMPPDEFQGCALPAMLGLLAEFNPDCIVAELGASPLEPYNGLEVLKELLLHSRPSQVFIVLCATDAYAASGLCQALVSEGLEFEPDVVCGMAANNSAGIALVERVSGLPALNLEDPLCVVELRKLLKKRLLDR